MFIFLSTWVLQKISIHLIPKTHPFPHFAALRSGFSLPDPMTCFHVWQNIHSPVTCFHSDTKNFTLLHSVPSFHSLILWHVSIVLQKPHYVQKISPHCTQFWFFIPWHVSIVLQPPQTSPCCSGFDFPQYYRKPHLAVLSSKMNSNDGSFHSTTKNLTSFWFSTPWCMGYGIAMGQNFKHHTTEQSCGSPCDFNLPKCELHSHSSKAVLRL